MRYISRIGHTSKNYSQKRFIFKKFSNAKYVDVRFLNLYFWLNIHLWALRFLKLTKLTEEQLYMRLFLKYNLILPGLVRLDILHFFNTINFSLKPSWVVTVETCVPFNNVLLECIQSKNPDFSILSKDQNTKRAIKFMADKSCKGLLSMSTCTYNIQMEILHHFPEYADAIKKKSIVLHPPQDLLVNQIEDKHISYDDDGLIRFVFIGRDFYRKGGYQILTVLEQFKNKYKFELVLISEIKQKECFAFFSEKDCESSLKYLSENADWIKYYPSLSNDQVLRQIKEAHVALLPTWMDTYGYSVLECQASGCPVVTTNVRALTEINSEELGWIIPVPVNKLKHPLYGTEEDFNCFKTALENGLYTALNDIFQNRKSIKEKGIKCIQNISAKHNPAHYAKILDGVYKGELTSDI